MSEEDFCTGIGFEMSKEAARQRSALICLQSNSIETAKYNYMTFIPKNLLVQFRKTANIYFIVIAICQSIQGISTTDGKPLILLALSVMVVISMVKDWVEDRKRHRRDQEENKSLAKKLNSATNLFEEVAWETLRAGDIIKVNEGEKFPADILILSSSEAKGTCFIETKNLDGETNLKHRGSVLAQAFPDDSSIILASKQQAFCVIYEKPNEFIHRFNGMVIDNSNISHAVSLQNACFRGCILKNTESVSGVVVYAGHDCKSLMNASAAHMKQSTIEVSMHRYVIAVFGILILTSIFCSAYYVIWYQANQYELPYLQIPSNDIDNRPFLSFLARIPMWVLLLNTYVPISLLMTLEMVRYYQGYLLSKDKNFATVGSDECVEVNSSNLIDQLGSVQYVLSDKTGTLTGNEMSFKAISVNSLLYQHDYFEDKTYLRDEKLRLRLARPLEFPIEMEAMMCMVLCHQLIVQEVDGKRKYSGASADEECLMEFCVGMGIYYNGVDQNNVVTIIDEINNRKLYFKMLDLHEYESALGKMCVLVEDLQTNIVKVYQKGSASKILHCLAPTTQQKVSVKDTKEHLDQLASKILRTLCLSYRELSREFTDEWLNLMQRELSSCTVGGLKETKDIIFAQIEDAHILLGGTGVNDAFQEDVPQTLDRLRLAGIKVWMITGDKRETALSIGFRCNLIQNQESLVIFDCDEDDSNSESDEESLRLRFQQSITELISKCRRLADQGSQFCIAISGFAMHRLTNKKANSSNSPPNEQLGAAVLAASGVDSGLQNILSRATSVIAFSFTPKQKALLVHIVKTIAPNQTILAIGDGANDVSMLQAAHVSIGLRGKEGSEAAKSADFSVSQFRHLNRLILYVGQEALRKNSELILFNFYKNQAWIGAYVWFNFFCGMSGQYIYDQWVSQFYNVVFASVPIIIFALFDEQLSTEPIFNVIHSLPNMLEKIPIAYAQQKQNPIFTNLNFLYHVFRGFFDSLLLIIVAYFCMGSIPNYTGREVDIFNLGMWAFSACVILVNVRVHLLHYSPTLISVSATGCSILAFFMSLGIANEIPSFSSYAIYQTLFQYSVTPYACFFLTVAIAVLPDIAVAAYKGNGEQHKYKQIRQPSREDHLIQQPSQEDNLLAQPSEVQIKFKKEEDLRTMEQSDISENFDIIEPLISSVNIGGIQLSRRGTGSSGITQPYYRPPSMKPIHDPFTITATTSPIPI